MGFKGCRDSYFQHAALHCLCVCPPPKLNRELLKRWTVALERVLARKDGWVNHRMVGSEKEGGREEQNKDGGGQFENRRKRWKEGRMVDRWMGA